MLGWGGELPVSIDFPREPQNPRRRRSLLILLVVLAVLVFGARNALSYWVDLLWFTSLGYGEVFWKTLSLQWGVCAFFAVATFVILFGAFSALKRAHQGDLPRDHKLIFGGQPVNLSVEPVLRIAGWIVSLGGAFLSGASMMDDWPALALWWYSPRGGSGAGDPIFGKPLSFFLFTLPAWHMIVDWLLTLSIAVCLMAVFFLIISGGMRVFDKGKPASEPVAD